MRWVGITDRLCVEATIVHAETQAAILFLGEDDGSSVGAVTLLDDALMQQILNVGLDFIIVAWWDGTIGLADWIVTLGGDRVVDDGGESHFVARFVENMSVFAYKGF